MEEIHDESSSFVADLLVLERVKKLFVISYAIFLHLFLPKYVPESHLFAVVNTKY